MPEPGLDENMPDLKLCREFAALSVWHVFPTYSSGRAISALSDGPLGTLGVAITCSTSCSNLD